MSTLSIYTLTYNCGRLPLDPQTISTHLFSALAPQGSPPDILILCLQELAPIAYSFLGGSYLDPYLSPLRHAVSLAGAALDDAEYVNIITRNLGMTAIMVFVLRDQTSQVRWLETAGIGLGVQRMGNKGAVGVRMGWSVGDETVDLTFVSAHLAAMEEALERRNEDWRDIVRGLVFTPVPSIAVRKRTTQRLPQEASISDTEPLLPGSGKPEQDSIPSMLGIYTPTSHLILAGDLNYRTSTIRPTSTAHHSYPQPTKDEASSKHYSHLLKKDQLTPERLASRTCHGLQEAPITFPPTYKYSLKPRSKLAALSDNNDQEGHWFWSRHRYPSWCDRVLYLPMPPWIQDHDSSSESQTQIQVQRYKALPLMPTSDHRPVACSFSVPTIPIPEPNDMELSKYEDKRDVRLVPPYGVDALWREQRIVARRKEVLVGVLAYVTLTWEGRGVLAAVICGLLGGWAVVRSLLEV